jgi:carboxymethylenebutenolidase
MNYFQNYLAEEFVEDYQEGRINRRQALKLLAKITGSLVAANSFLAACTPAPEAVGIPPTGGTPTLAAASSATAPSATSSGTAQPAVPGTTRPDEPTLEASPVQFQGKDAAPLQGYLARPKTGGPFALVLVCHENRGLTDHIRDVTRRLAKAGYAALAVDLLSRKGGTASLSFDEIPGELGSMPPEQFAQDFQSGLEYLKGQPFAQVQRVGMIGFCFGGGVTWKVAVSLPELRAAVPFYGPPPPLTDLPKIQAAVLAIYGGNDARITQTAPAVEEAMLKNHKTFEKVIYPNADHAFFNDTGPRYNPEAARDAWNKTLAWFQKYMA